MWQAFCPIKNNKINHFAFKKKKMLTQYQSDRNSKGGWTLQIWVASALRSLNQTGSSESSSIWQSQAVWKERPRCSRHRKEKEKEKVAEDRDPEWKESVASLSFRQKVFPHTRPVVYTPKRAAAPRADSATLWSKNVYVTYLARFPEGERTQG